jgi:ATP-dependent RNA helicase DDX56/DBP9
MVLVPTRELSEQVTKYVESLLTYCEKEVRVVNLASNVATKVQK